MLLFLFFGRDGNVQQCEWNGTARICMNRKKKPFPYVRKQAQQCQQLEAKTSSGTSPEAQASLHPY
jgi:hypothetical protein